MYSDSKFHEEFTKFLKKFPKMFKIFLRYTKLLNVKRDGNRRTSFHFETRKYWIIKRDWLLFFEEIHSLPFSLPSLLPFWQTILIPRKRSSYRGIDHSPAFCSLKFYFAQGKQQIMLESSTSSPLSLPMHSAPCMLCAYTRRFHYPLHSSPPGHVVFLASFNGTVAQTVRPRPRGLSLFSA